MLLFYIVAVFIYIFILFFVLTTIFILLSSVFYILKGFVKPYAPYIPIPEEVLKKIIKYIKIEKNSVVYDLGSGDGRILFYLFDFYKKGHFIGIEFDWFPYFISKLKSIKYPKNLKFYRKDFYRTDISNADIILVYLFPEVLDTLLPKMERELNKGVVVYSIDFIFSKKVPDQEIILENDKTKRGQKLFIYRF